MIDRFIVTIVTIRSKRKDKVALKNEGMYKVGKINLYMPFEFLYNSLRLIVIRGLEDENIRR